MNTLNATKESKKVVTKNTTNEVINAITQPINLKNEALKNTQSLSDIERVKAILPRLNALKLRDIKKSFKESTYSRKIVLTKKDKKEIIDLINTRLMLLAREKHVQRHAKVNARVITEKSIVKLENKSEFFNIFNIVKALKDSDKKRVLNNKLPLYGLLKSKSLKLTSLNLFLSEAQFSNVIINKGLYTFDSIQNAVEKLQNFTEAQRNLVYSYSDEVHALIVSNEISFIQKLELFESLKEKIGL